MASILKPKEQNYKNVQSIIFFLIICCGTCVFLLSACNSDSTDPGYTILDIESILNGKSTSTPDLIIKSVIPLETNDLSLIGEVTRLEFFNDRFYILDRFSSKALFIFNSKGEFLAKTPSGKGPGELLDPWDFYIDKKGSQIIVFDQATFRMLTYDTNLLFISSETLPGLAIRNFKKLSKDTVLVFAQSPVMSELKHGSAPIYYNYFIYTNSFTKITKMISPYPQEISGITLSSPINTAGNGIVFLEPFNYAIKKLINADIIKKVYYLDFGEYSVTEQDIQRGLNYIFLNSRAGKRITSLDYIFDNDNFLVTSFFFRGMLHFVIYCKEKNEIYFSNNLFMNGLLPICSVQGLNETEFIGVVNSEDLISFLKKNNIPNIYFTPDIFDNQYLILFEIIDKKS